MTCWLFSPVRLDPVLYSNPVVLSTSSIGNDGTLFYLVTNQDAPREKIVTIDITDPNFTRKDLVPEQKDAKLEIGMLIKDHLVVVYKRDVRGLSFLFEQTNNDQPMIIGQRRDLHLQPQDWEIHHPTRSRVCRRGRHLGQKTASSVLRHPHELH